MKLPRIGVIQGRLLPPVNGRIQSFPADDWQREFVLAAGIGVGSIEFIFEAEQWEANPLLSSSDRETIRNLSKQNGVSVDTVCLDYFMECCLWRDAQTSGPAGTDMLLRLVDHAVDIGVRVVNIPLLGCSKVEDDASQVRAFDALLRVARKLGDIDVKLALETSLPPMALHGFIHQLDNPLFGINYDTGNSAYFGYSVREEMAEYAHHIYSVHIKDCVQSERSVGLGTGGTDFPAFFTAILKSDYQGPIVLQSARTEPDPLQDVAVQVRFVHEQLARFSGRDCRD